MKVLLNGTEEEVTEQATVADLVSRVVDSDPSRGVAVAVNGEVIPKRKWEDVGLSESDRVEILRAIGGG